MNKDWWSEIDHARLLDQAGAERRFGMTREKGMDRDDALDWSRVFLEAAKKRRLASREIEPSS